MKQLQAQIKVHTELLGEAVDNQDYVQVCSLGTELAVLSKALLVLEECTPPE